MSETALLSMPFAGAVPGSGKGRKSRVQGKRGISVSKALAGEPAACRVKSTFPVLAETANQPF